MEVIANLIQTIGFPCFVAIYLLVFMKKTLDGLYEALNELKLTISEQSKRLSVQEEKILNELKCIKCKD